MKKKIIGIYLAAGKSERFGKNKLHQPVGTTLLGSLALSAAIQSQLDKIVVVTNKEDKLIWISPSNMSCYKNRWLHVACPYTSLGQAFSLKCGLSYAKKLKAEAVVILLADQPFIYKDMIDQLIIRYKELKTKNVPAHFVASTISGIPRPPILMTESMFNDMDRLQGDKGARHLIRDKKWSGNYIQYKNPLPFFDVDTAEDYKRLLEVIIQ